jgi:hypothetical protein
MIISAFTEIELEFYRQTCNFVGDERDLFEMRSEGIPLETIAEELHLTFDAVKKKSQKVNNKIKRVRSTFEALTLH